MAKMQQDKMDEAVLSLDLPGFRFHPTEEELLEFYLRNVIFHEKLYFDVIGFLNIYRHDPWELPDLSKVGEREWYFFVPRDKKPSNGGRSSRTTPTGYWKATGSERKVVTLSDPKRVVGSRKTLVFYKGRAPRGTKTDWIMNEYRLPDNRSLPKVIVLCKVYRKATSLKVLEQWATIGEAKTITTWSTPESTPQFQESYYTTSDLSNGGTANAASHYGPQEYMKKPMINCHVDDDALLWDEGIDMVTGSCKADEIRLPLGQVGLPELQVPKIVDWAQDPLWAQLFSPLFDNIFSQTTPCANL